MELFANKTALIIIDLQKGIVGMQTQPYRTVEVVQNAAKLAQAFRAKGAFVAAVNVTLNYIFPRIGRIRTTEEILTALQ